MAHLGTVGTATANTGTTSVAITLAAAVPVGSTIMVGAAWESAAESVPTVTSIVDSGGNTYTEDVSVNSGATVAVAAFRARVSTALDIGDTVTITLDESRARWSLQADAFDDIDASPLDQTASNADGPATALSTGTTSATTSAAELVYAIFGFGANRTVTVPDGWSGGAKVETSAGSADRALQVVHRYVTATGPQEGTLTIDPSGVYAGAVATYTSAGTPVAPVAQVSQLAMEAPQPGAALLARVSQLAMEAPAGVVGEVRVAQLSLTAPTKDGQAPYSGIKAARDGRLWDATIATP